MHFWINKPAGRNYGFGGRRYPCSSSSAPKTRSGQRGRRGREIGPMVTPVHRFQSLNGPPTVRVCYPGTSEATTRVQQPQRHQQHHQSQQQVSQNQQQQLVAQLIPGTEEDTTIPTTNFNPRRNCVPQGVPRNIVTSNNVTNAAAAAAAAAAGGNNDRQIITNETTINGRNRPFLDFSEISDTELAGYRLRCGVWITFVLATGFVSVAKFYFGHREAGLDMLIFCGLLFTLLLSGCFYSTLFRRAHNRRNEDPLEQEEQIATLAAALTIRDDNVRGRHTLGYMQYHSQELHLPLQLQQQQQQQQPPPPPPPPPPPYHIAILIPPPNSPEEAPPPSYDKAMNEDSANQTRVFIFAKDEENN